MFDVFSDGIGLVKSWTIGVPVEQSAKEQLQRVARMPFIVKWVAAMPDVHTGIGATVGSVIATRGAVIPAAVGVDIGCGMIACRIDKKRDQLESSAELRRLIEQAVPHGRTDNGGENDKGAWQVSIPEQVHQTWTQLVPGYETICCSHPAISKANTERHLGTLGTGNHFIELTEDELDSVWVVIHSGSRGVGGKIGSYFTALAKSECSNWFIPLDDPNLAYFPEHTQFFHDYLIAVRWAQQFAKSNRALMLGAVLTAIGANDIETIDCYHNFVDREHHYGTNVLVTRKGAVRARECDMAVIPGSMGAKSFIVRGRGKQESFCSCSHGAGRSMSRSEAKRRFTIDDHVQATEGIECRKDLDVIDETPAAYKNIDAVMAAQADLVEIVHTLRQFVCVKG